MSSLRARLLGWLRGVVLAVGALGGFIVYHNALREADAFFDYHLRQTALVLRDEPVGYQLAPRIAAPDPGYDFVVQVWSLAGVRVYLSRPHASLPQVPTLGFSTVGSAEGRWRVFGVQAGTRVIQVAQPMSVRQQRAADLALETLKPFALLLPALALLIWFAVGQALKPLERLTALVQARRIESLEGLPAEPLPAEVQPLVRALNELLARLRSALGRESAFMDDAAHELRTILTALHMQIGMLARQERERAPRGHADIVAGSSAPSAHRADPALARQEPRAASPHGPCGWMSSHARWWAAPCHRGPALHRLGRRRRAAGERHRRCRCAAHAAAQPGG
jgi:signal transduction histidine kinase